ncbi:MAG TPA: ParA family protein [Anaerolineae bacterium]|nr:ParA family protein [Anaerolineae bacterium]
MSRIIAVANQKGGTGKTTTSINLACGWSRLFAPGRVLLIDIDPQANATAVLLGLEFAAGPRQSSWSTVRELLREDVAAEAALQRVELPANNQFGLATVDILPAHLELAMIETELAVAFRGEYRLKKALTPLLDQYDLIVLDCPPSLGILTLNALVFAQEVLIPVDPGVFPLIGLNLLRQTINQVSEVNPQLHIAGVLPTMSMNTVLSRETIQQLEANFPDLVLPPIPRRVSIEESHVNGIDVFGSAPTSDGAQAYVDVLEALYHRE